jgi:hypothetical protein
MENMRNIHRAAARKHGHCQKLYRTRSLETFTALVVLKIGNAWQLSSTVPEEGEDQQCCDTTMRQIIRFVSPEDGQYQPIYSTRNELKMKLMIVVTKILE